MRTAKSAADRSWMRGALGRIYAGVFKERELLLRSNGRVRFLRLTARLQLCIVILVGAVLLWGAGGSLLTWRGYELIKARDGRLADAQVAFDDLLEEIAIYQRKVSKITGKLRQNQSDLVRQFALADALEAEARATEEAVPAKNERLAAITQARAAMDWNVRQLQGDLRMMTGLDTVLKSSLNAMKSDLAEAAAERQKGYQARAILIAEVKQLTGALKASQIKTAALRKQSDALGSRLTRSRAETERGLAARVGLKARVAELQRTLDGEVRRGAELEMQVAKSRAALDGARSDYERISSLRADLDVKVAGLQGALNAEADRSNALEANLQKIATELSGAVGVADGQNPVTETLSTRIASLLNRLTVLHRARATVMDTLQTRTAGSVEEAERILGMTGLDIETVLAKIEASQSLGEGGPFVAALPDGVELTGFAGKVNGLDTQLNRLEALRSALRAIPLVAPLDGYRLTSGFGKRRDPITKKWALHSGLDMSAPSRTPVRASAPGVVTMAAWNGRFGRMIEIDHGLGIRTRYAHLRKILVKKGQRVGYREKVALVGNSGRSTGPHLHYEIVSGKVAVDPLRFIKAGKYVFKE